MALYGAPIWVDKISRRLNASLLRAPQRAIAQRVARAYKTVSFSPACALAGTPPWEEEAKVLASIYEWTVAKKEEGEPFCLQEREAMRKEANKDLVRRWSASLGIAEFGRWTTDALAPVLDRWLERSHGFLSFRMVQIMTGHGCFGKFLHRIEREETPRCHACGADEDTAEHTLAVCSSWDQQRQELVRVVGSDLSLPTIVGAMVTSDQAFTAFASFCEDVMSQKEAAERQREEDPLACARRRARRGRRHRPDARLPSLRGRGRSVRGAGVPPLALHRPPSQLGRDDSALPAVPISPPARPGEGF